MFDYAAHGLRAPATRLDLPGGAPHTIGAVLERQLQVDPHRLALVGRSARYSYGELDREVDRAAAVLHAQGIRQYDRLAACLPNDVDIVIALLACARLGAIWVGINRPLAPPEKVALLQDSGARIYLTDLAGCEEIGPQRSKLPVLERVICVEPASPSSAWHTLLSDVEPQPLPAVTIDPFAPAAIAYTSGTTGTPKGAVHSHHNVLLPGAIATFENRFGPGCPVGAHLPLTILNLMVLAPLHAFQAGAACVCMDSLKPQDMARWVRQERIGHFSSVPTVMQDLLTSPAVAPEDLASLGRPDVGGAGIAESFQRLYRERFGRPMTVAYGMTEAPTIVAKTDPDREPENELCGRAVAQVEIVIVDGSDQPLPTGEIGEICVRPASGGPYANVYTPMLGYWNRPDATAEALSHGLYHTGDLGLVDEKGELYIRGRRKELILRGGANVYPGEVERLLAEHPKVAEAAVLGIPDERLGQRVVAVVQLLEAVTGADEAGLTAELTAFCREHIARYKVPEQFRFVGSLPRNAMNKVVKPQLLHLF
jgi:long-chain acyl-CoA synthetase